MQKTRFWRGGVNLWTEWVKFEATAVFTWKCQAINLKHQFENEFIHFRINERALKCFEFGPGQLGPIGKFCGEVCLHKSSVYSTILEEGEVTFPMILAITWWGWELWWGIKARKWHRDTLQKIFCKNLGKSIDVFF